MTYALFRGSRLLGKIVADNVTPDRIQGAPLWIVPVAGADSLRGETQMHVRAILPEPMVFRMLDEPAIVDSQASPHRSHVDGSSIGGSFALKPMTDGDVVVPEDELRVRQDDDALLLRTITLQETRFLQDPPANEVRDLPPGVLSGRSVWTVIIQLDERRDDTGQETRESCDFSNDDLSP